MDGWFAAGEFESAYAVKIDRRPHDIADFLESENVFPRQPNDAVGRHAVNTAEIAAVGDAQPQNPHGGDRSRTIVQPGSSRCGGSGNFCDRKSHEKTL